MVINVTGRRFKVWPELHEAAVESAQKFTKLIDNIQQTDIVFSEDHGKSVEFTVYINSASYNAGAEAENFDHCINIAAEKITAQLRKLKEKQIQHR